MICVVPEGTAAPEHVAERYPQLDGVKKRLVSSLSELKEKILIFEDKLKNIQVPADLRMEIGSFLSFADFFFDGPIADYLIQSEIQKTLEDIDDAITHVESIINSIRLQQEVK